jgi:hypothetical protein
MVVDDVKVEFLDPAPAEEISPKPLVVRTMEEPIFHAGNRDARGVFKLPPADYEAQRIVLSLTLKPGPGGWDNWDRGASVYVLTGPDEGEKVEILRWITPFRREYTWRADVTDYQSLLRGEARLGVSISSWQKKEEDPAKQRGFRVILDFAYYPGKPEVEAYRVVNLWNLHYVFGNTPEEIAAAFPPREVPIPVETVAAKVRVTVTGHGSFGEFTPAERTLAVNDRLFESTLFKTDVYLNPVRPQAGTWKFNRAGWAPGSLVDPWDVDVTDLATPGKDLRLRYEPKPFEEPKDRKFEASHTVASQLILYRKRDETK